MKCPKCKFYSICCGRLNETVENCARFKSVELTNEEWIKSANTEQLAEFFHGIVIRAMQATWDGKKPDYPAYLSDWKKWLKQPHREIGK